MPNDLATPPVEPHLDPRSFLRGTPPFDVLTAEAFEQAAGALEIAYFPQGTRILSADGAPSDALYVVRKGLVRLEKNGETSAVLEEGEFFGYSVMTGQVSADVVVEEDLLAYRIPEAVFRRLLAFAPFARFFTQGLAERLRDQPAFSAETACGGNILLPVGSLAERPPVTVPAEATVLEAARVMRDEGVSSVLLLSDPPAIVTDRDLRNRVLAAGLGPETPARVAARSSSAEKPCARSTCTRQRPIIPAPTTTAVSPTATGVRLTACAATATGSTMAACSKLTVSGTR